MSREDLDLENYIREIHAEQYTGTDDMMVDDYNDWILCQDIDAIIKWATIWHKKREVELLEGILAYKCIESFNEEVVSTDRIKKLITERMVGKG